MPQTQAPPRANSQVTVFEDTSWERLWASETSHLIGYVRPWASLLATFGVGYVSHRLWGHMPDVPWAASVLSIAAVGMPGFTWMTSRLAPVGRVHSAATVAALLAWLDIATVTGPTSEAAGFLLGVVGGVMALSWNIRGNARNRLADAHRGGQEPADRLAAWFNDAAKEAGIGGATLTGITATPTKATGTVQLDDGKTAADLLSKVAAIESAAKLPPGSIITSVNPDRADKALFTMSDPRVLTRPIPWPGPSAPGQSIAKPLRPGLWQTGDPVAYVVIGQSVYMMGAAGSGKSIGGGWNLLGEAMTRPDCAIILADITKGEQTFGPLRPAVHRFERDIKGVRNLVGGLTDILQPRTDYLAAKGLQKWAEGCGLSYLIVWVEETGDVFDKIGSKGEEQLINIARAIRSAGGSLVFSVQRNTYDQTPTIVRAQMASMCFGLNDPQDCRFGLSEAQLNAGVNPAEWGIRHPGMAYLDAATIPESLITTPLRTYDWGGNDELMTAHAAQWPASLRPVDPITAQICGGPVASDGPRTGIATDRAADLSPQAAAARAAAVPARPSVTLTAPVPEDQADAPDDDDADPIGDPVGEYLEGADDPSPEITAAAIADGPDAPIEGEADDVRFDFEPGPQMSPDDARRVFADQLATWREDGRESFAPRDFGPVMRTTGMRRGWIQARLKEAIEADPPQLERDDRAGCYRFTERTPL
jgi:hypothetical protein